MHSIPVKFIYRQTMIFSVPPQKNTLKHTKQGLVLKFLVLSRRKDAPAYFAN